jgi:hypothetical protein
MQKTNKKQKTKTDFIDITELPDRDKYSHGLAAENISYCKAKQHQLGNGWKMLIAATFLMLLWLLANPHFEPAQRIHISKSVLVFITELPRSMAYDTLCTKDTIIVHDLKNIGTKWVTGGECAMLQDYMALVVFNTRLT